MANVVNFGISPGSIAAGLSMESNSREVEYVLTFDVPVDDSETVLALPDVPFPGYPFDFNETLKCTGISLQPDANNHRVWRIRAQYDAGGMPIQEGKAYGFRSGTNPITKAARGAYAKLGLGSYERVDNYGQESAEPTIAIETSAGNPFGDPLTYIQHNPVLSWWQIESAAVGDIIESGEYAKYIGTINSESINICGRTYPAESVLIKSMEPEQYYYRNPYGTQSEFRWKTTYTVEIALDGWWDKVLDQDFEAILNKSEDDATLIKRPIRLADLPYNAASNKVRLNDANDDYVQSPVKLDGTGDILGEDDDPVYIEYLVKKPLDWKELNLATEIAR